MNLKNKSRQTRVTPKLSNDGRESSAEPILNDPMDIPLFNENTISNCPVETSSNEGRRNSNDLNSCLLVKSGEDPMINGNESFGNDDGKRFLEN